MGRWKMIFSIRMNVCKMNDKYHLMMTAMPINDNVILQSNNAKAQMYFLAFY